MNNYSIEYDESNPWFLFAYTPDHRVAGKLLALECPSKQVRIDDIQVYDRVPIRASGLIDLWYQLVRRPTTSLRRNGVGSQLLRFLLAQAELGGISRVYGYVTQSDQDQFDREGGLTAWYEERFGFQICLNPPPEPGVLLVNPYARIDWFNPANSRTGLATTPLALTRMTKQ